MLYCINEKNWNLQIFRATFYLLIKKWKYGGRVKAGKFGHQVNSDTHLQAVEITMRRLLMSRLIRFFTVCLVNLFFIPINELWNKQGGWPSLAVCPNIPDFILMCLVQRLLEELRQSNPLLKCNWNIFSFDNYCLQLITKDYGMQLLNCQNEMIIISETSVF